MATLPPSGTEEFLLPRPKGPLTLAVELRAALCEAAARAGIAVHIVPHQLRHTYATSMLRAGVSLPALMKLLGHRNANMTLRYVEITQHDLQREFHSARLSPRHLIPLPPQLSTPGTVIDSDASPDIFHHLACAIRILELLPVNSDAALHKPIRLLLRRLVRVRSRLQILFPHPN